MAQSKEKITKLEFMFLMGCIKQAKDSLLLENDAKTQAREFNKYADSYIAKLKAKNED